MVNCQQMIPSWLHFGYAWIFVLSPRTIYIYKIYDIYDYELYDYEPKIRLDSIWDPHWLLKFQRTKWNVQVSSVRMSFSLVVRSFKMYIQNI